MKKIQITIGKKQITKALIFLAYVVIGFFLIFPLLALGTSIPFSLPDFFYGTFLFVIFQGLFVALEIAIVIFLLNLAVKALFKIKTDWLFVVLASFTSVFLLNLLISLKDAYEYRVYSNKNYMCRNFAQNYLNSIRKIENIDDFVSNKYKMMIDVKTDLYELCSLELDEQSLGNWESIILKKYQSR